MKKISVLFMSILAGLMFGQDRKGTYQLTPNSGSHTMYVAFKKIADNHENTAAAVMTKNALFSRFVSSNKIQFNSASLISSEKLHEMASQSFSKTGTDESVQKLRRIYTIITPDHDNASLLKLAKELEQFDEVEYVSLMSNEPVEPPKIATMATPTANLESLQTYFTGSAGIGADYAWNKGINGEGITIRDVEYGFNKNHEALSDQAIIQVEPGYSPNSALLYPNGAYYSWLDHGTAVASIFAAKRDNIGVGGSVPNAAKFIGYLEWTTVGYDRVGAVSRAIQAASPFEIIIYEMQTGGQNNSYVPAEYDNVIWDLTKAATDSGITVIAAAGNGSENLDSAFYDSYNARGNSGAIIVGAGSANATHSILSFSTYGSRVNLQGWGQGVMAAGYGSYVQYDNDYNRTYAWFSGTSSATPVVASAFALVQSYYKQKTGNYASTQEILTLLKTTGIPQGGDLSKQIGPFPNVKNAIQKVETQLGTAAENAAHLLDAKLYPNPATDFVTLKLSGSQRANIEVFSMSGQLLYQTTAKNNVATIDVKHLPKGSYIVKISDGNKSSTQKLIKK